MITDEKEKQANSQEKVTQEWRYAVVGNITKSHIDSQGILRYGSSAFCGGTKVYLCGKYWTMGRDKICVIGFNRFHRFVFNDLSPDLIENVRCQKVYKPSVLKLMGNWEFQDAWWDNSVAAKKETKRFVETWNNQQMLFREGNGTDC